MTKPFLNLFALFHLNLAFSSIEEEQRAQVIRDCYGPVLDLAERHGPVGVEATAYTLQVIETLEPAWLERLRHLINSGKVELIWLCPDYRAAGAGWNGGGQSEAGQSRVSRTPECQPQGRAGQ
jgi:hypothetical protein